ncbi:MAG: AI-2E family transporter, partial [Bacteroidia bacterium]
VPLSFAVLISFVLYPICKWLENHKVPRTAAIAISILLVVLLVAGLVYLVISQTVQFADEWPALKGKLQQSLHDVSAYIGTRFHISLEDQTAWVENIAKDASTELLPFLQKTIYAGTITSVLVILIPFYSALILYGRRQFVEFLFLVFPQVPQEEMITILRQTITTFYGFINGTLIVHLVVAILNSIGLALIGVPHPILFGVMGSLLTFVPYVGITIGSIVPMAVAWITFGSIWYPIGVVAVFTFVQYLEANIIFPLAVSYRLQVNTLFTLLAIVAGGILWGASGMILFIPFLGILKLIADHSDRLKPISVLLGTEDNNKPVKGVFKRKYRYVKSGE